MKQHLEMSLFVNTLSINNNSLFFSDAKVDITMPSPCSASSHAFSVNAFRWRIWENTRTDHVTQNALATQNNEAYGQGKVMADSLSVQSFAIIKNTGHGNFVIGRFHTTARNGLSVWDWPVHCRPLPPYTPSPIFFWGEGAAVHRLSVRQNWRIKSGGLFI